MKHQYIYSVLATEPAELKINVLAPADGGAEWHAFSITWFTRCWVCIVGLGQVLAESAYMLFYVRESLGPSLQTGCSRCAPPHTSARIGREVVTTMGSIRLLVLEHYMAAGVRLC